MEFHRIRRFQTPLLLILLFLAAWIPRVVDLDVFATPDEHLWLARSANFYQAIASGHLEDTFQREHPGVTVMWAGTLGFLQRLPEYAEEATGQLDWRTEYRNELSDWLENNSTVRPLELLAAGRWWMALAISLLIAACFLPMQDLFGPLIGVLAVLFLAWDPFFIALSRLLHLDGLLTALVTLTLLTFLAWLYVHPKWYVLVVSGILLGLAGLTKTPAVFVAVAVGLILLGEWWRQRRAKETTPRRILLGYVVWGGVALLTVVALWPALWVNPLGVLQNIRDEMVRYAGGHTNFFLGEVTTDPGLLFYPIAWMFRTTPATVIGLIAAILWGWRKSWPLDTSVRRWSAWALIVFALFFVVSLSVADKMFDRYILPIFPALDIVATLGWLGLARFVVTRMTSLRADSEADRPVNGRLVAAIALVGLVLLHGLFSLLHFPYYLTYYNPLVGGSRTAPRALMVGWGEGLNEAADWLNQQLGAGQMKVVSAYGESPLDYFLRGPRLIRPYNLPAFWFAADYAVHYVNQWQRNAPSKDMVAYLSSLTPVHVVRSHGIELARIYDLRTAPLPEFLTYDPRSAASFGGQIMLWGHRIEQRLLLSGDTQQVTLLIEPTSPMGEDYDALVQLMGSDGTVLWQNRRQPADRATSNWPRLQREEHDVELVVPDDAPSGWYALTLAFEDPLTGQFLPLNRDHGEPVGDDNHHAVTWIQVQRPETFHLDAQWEQVQLTSLRHQPDLRPGETLLTELSATGQVDGSMQISARLLDPAGNIVSLYDQSLTSVMRFPLDLPPDAEPGSYTLAVVLYDLKTLEPYPDSTGSLSTPLTTVLVQPAPP